MTLDYWDDKTDAIVNGDNLRDVNQILGKTFIDDLGFLFQKLNLTLILPHATRK